MNHLTSTVFYVLLKDSFVYPDFFNFGIYKQENNLTAVEDFWEWLKKDAIEGEKEWLECSDSDKCGLEEWLLSDDPNKNNPEKCKRVKGYLGSFSIKPTTERLKLFFMAGHKTCDKIPCCLLKNGQADLDEAILLPYFIKSLLWGQYPNPQNSMKVSVNK